MEVYRMYHKGATNAEPTAYLEGSGQSTFKNEAVNKKTG